MSNSSHEDSVRRIHQRIALLHQLDTVGPRLTHGTWMDNLTGEVVRFISYPHPNIFKIDWFPYRPGTPLSEIAQQITTEELRAIDPTSFAADA